MRTGIVAVGLVLVGCGGSGVSAKLTTACMKDGTMTEAQCRCVANRATKDLSKDAQELIVAEMEENRARVDELTKNMSMADAASVGTFMMNVVSQCATGQGSE